MDGGAGVEVSMRCGDSYGILVSSSRLEPSLKIYGGPPIGRRNVVQRGGEGAPPIQVDYIRRLLS